MGSELETTRSVAAPESCNQSSLKQAAGPDAQQDQRRQSARQKEAGPIDSGGAGSKCDGSARRAQHISGDPSAECAFHSNLKKEENGE